MSEVIIYKATKGKNGKYFYFETLEKGLTIRISETDFEYVSITKKVFDKVFDEDKKLIGYKVENEEAHVREAKKDHSGLAAGCVVVMLLLALALFGFAIWFFFF